MAIIWRIIAALIFGSAFYAGLLFTVFRFALPLAIKKILVWNIIVFRFVGRGDPVDYMPNGSPIYDGSSGYLGFSVESILTGFIIYPVFIFVILTVLDKVRTRKD